MITFRTNQKNITVDCYQKLNLLAHAQMESVPTGSQCGGHGICGKDIMKLSPDVFNQFSPPTAIEKKHLSAEQIEQGYRLGCQCYPSRDNIDTTIEIVL